MATGGFDPSRRKIQQVCRYYVHGACHKGDACKFVHDRTGSAPANNVCKFYQMGKCSYGDRCRYDHVRAGRSDKSANTQSNRASRSGISFDTDLDNEGRSSHSRGMDKSFDSDRSPEDRNPDKGRMGNALDSDRSHRSRIYRNGEDRKSSMVTLKKGGVQEYSCEQKQPARSNRLGDSWVKAKDFVPGEKFHAGASYARATKKHCDEDESAEVCADLPKQGTNEEDLLCPYFSHGNCPYGDTCTYTHGDVCELCQFPRLHPTDTAQREHHKKECMKELEKDMEHSFAVHESKDKECCICLELVLEKAEKNEKGASKSFSEQRFGILENCSHCFCLSCIRRWRSDKSFGKNVRVCPICRVHSDFVTPSDVWIEEEEKKKKFIQDYKDALSHKPCQYFKQGKGHCPFNEKCFYKHAYPDGTIAKPKPRKPRRRVDADGEMSTMDSISLWDFLERREDGLISLEDELSLYLLGMLHDSDDDGDDFLFGLGWTSSSDSDSDFEF